MSQLMQYLDHQDRTAGNAYRQLGERLGEDQRMQQIAQNRMGFNSGLGELQQRIQNGQAGPEDVAAFQSRLADYAAANPHDQNFGAVYNPMIATAKGQIDFRNDLEMQRLKAEGKAKSVASKAASDKTNLKRQQKINDYWIKDQKEFAKEWQGSDAKKNMDSMRTKSNEMKSLLKIAKNAKTGAAASAAIINFNKLLDPTSVVREGEYDRAAEFGNLFDRLKNLNDKYSRGQPVPESVLKEMSDLGEMVFAMAKEAAAQKSREIKGRFDKTAAARGIKPNKDGKYDYDMAFGGFEPDVIVAKEREALQKKMVARAEKKYKSPEAVGKFISRFEKDVGRAPKPAEVKAWKETMVRRYVGGR